MLQTVLPIAQIALSVILIAVILLQPSSAGVSALGGSDSMQTFHTKRGFEKFLFLLTIVLGIIFAAFGVLAIIY